MGRILKNLQDGFVKYHSYGIVFRNGANVLVTKNRPCIYPILNCLWMNPKDVRHYVSTRKNERFRSIHCSSLFKSYLKAKNSNKTYYFSSEYNSETDIETESDSDDDTLVTDHKNTENETQDQIPGTGTPEQTPGNTPDTPNQTPDNK